LGADRPKWAERHHGWIIGVDWRLDGEIGGPDAPRWGVVWNPTTGEVVAVQIVDGEEAGVCVPLGWIPRPTRWGQTIPKLIRQAEGDGLLALAVTIQMVAADALYQQLLEVIRGEVESDARLTAGEGIR
jgi:hypothetical protein